MELRPVLLQTTKEVRLLRAKHDLGSDGHGTGRVTVVLNLIVKNERETLPLLLDSVRDVVTDYVIVDTGASTTTLISWCAVQTCLACC
jgi:hypothetical protein